MAKKMNWVLPALAIGGIGVTAFFFRDAIWYAITGEQKPPDEFRKRRWEGRRRHHSGGMKNDGYGDLYRDVFEARPPVKRLPVVDVSDLIDRRSAENDELSYIITDKDFKLYDINRKDMPGYKKYIKEPMFSKVVYGDKGDRPVIVPYYDGYSYATTMIEKQPELGRLTPGEQSLSNDRTNHLNLYAR